MKTSQLRKLLWLFCGVVLFGGCNDEAPYYGEGKESEFNRYYSNKLANDPMGGKLELTYSETELLGKEFYFHLMSDKTARIIFNDLIPGASSVTLENHAVTRTAGGGYFFRGTTTASNNAVFSYEGSVESTGGITPVMTVAVYDVALPANKLSDKGVFEIVQTDNTDSREKDPNRFDPDYLGLEYHNSFSTVFDWRWTDDAGVQKMVLDLSDTPVGELGIDINNLVTGLLSNIIYLLLTDVEFHDDGNITATYSPLPEDWIGFALGTPTPANRLPGTVSPRNLVTYHVDGSTVTIRPDLTMILNTVMTNRGLTRADEDDNGGLNIGELLPLILDLIQVVPELQRWLTEGIKFDLVKNDPNELVYNFYTVMGGTTVMDYDYYWKGDYRLVIAPSEIGILLKVLLPVLDMLDIDLSNLDLGDMGEMIEEMLGSMGLDLNELIDDVLGRIRSTDKLDIGLFLNGIN